MTQEFKYGQKHEDHLRLLLFIRCMFCKCFERELSLYNMMKVRLHRPLPKDKQCSLGSGLSGSVICCLDNSVCLVGRDECMAVAEFWFYGRRFALCSVCAPLLAQSTRIEIHWVSNLPVFMKASLDKLKYLGFFFSRAVSYY